MLYRLRPLDDREKRVGWACVWVFILFLLSHAGVSVIIHGMKVKILINYEQKEHWKPFQCKRLIISRLQTSYWTGTSVTMANNFIIRKKYFSFAWNVLRKTIFHILFKSVARQFRQIFAYRRWKTEHSKVRIGNWFDQKHRPFSCTYIFTVCIDYTYSFFFFVLDYFIRSTPGKKAVVIRQRICFVRSFKSQMESQRK